MTLVIFLMDSDATSLCPSAMRDDNSIHLEIETDYSFTIDMDDERIEIINIGNFNHRSGFLKVKHYNPPEIIFQHLPVKERINKIEVKRLRNGYIIDTLTSVDIKETRRIGGKLIEIYKGV